MGQSVIVKPPVLPRGSAFQCPAHQVLVGTTFSTGICVQLNYTDLAGVNPGGTGGGGGSSPPYISSLIAGPDSTKTISGATHGFASAALLVGIYDNASPRNAILAGWTVNPSTYDVVIYFAAPQSNYYVVINGGVGPQGAAGIVGPAGATGATGAAGGTGPQGTTGAAGTAGATGAAGQGVPTGGASGQVLSKIDGTNYNTQWVNQTSGSATNGTNGQGLTSNGSGGYGTPVTLAASATTDATNAGNIGSGTLGAGRLPAPTSSTLGGVKSLASVSHQFLTQIGTDGSVSQAQPAASDVSGLAASATTDATNASNIGSGTLANARLATSEVTKTVCIVIGSNNAGTVLADADLGPQSRQYLVNAPRTLVEITVAADNGTPQLILGRSRAGSIVNLTSAALATAASGGIACSKTGATTGLDGTTTCSGTLQNTSLNAGDWITLVSGTAGGVANEVTACLTGTVN